MQIKDAFGDSVELVGMGTILPSEKLTSKAGNFTADIAGIITLFAEAIWYICYKNN